MSKVVLGSMTWGRKSQTNKADALLQVKALLSVLPQTQKVILDTARIYQGGESEEIIGEILAENPDLKERIEVHTKVHPALGHLSSENVRKHLHSSLTALKLQFVDLFYLHSPDIDTPLEDTLRECNKLHLEGKFKALGLSNFASWDVVRAYYICKINGWIVPQVYQGCYNAINRSIEAELLPAVRSCGMAFYAYNPLAAGLLVGRYGSLEDLTNASTGRFSREFDFVPAEKRVGSIASMPPAFELYRKRYGNEDLFKGVSKIAQAREDVPWIDVPLRWLKHHSFLQEGDGIVFGASRASQAEANVKALLKGELPEKLIQGCNEAWAISQFAAEPYSRGYGRLPGGSEKILTKFRIGKY